MSDGYLVAQVHEALVHDPRTAEAGVEVKVSDRRVFLTGTVPTEERRAAIADVAAGVVPEGYEIRNETSVYCFDEPTSMESLP